MTRPPKSAGEVSAGDESSDEKLRTLQKQVLHHQREYKSVLRNAETYEEIAENGKRLLMRAQEQLELEIRGHRRTETALRLAKSDAEVASEAKSRFLATMSHEMRTPLNGVIGMLELLVRTSLDGSQQNLATLAQNSARTLVLLINQLLDFSKMEAGRVELDQTPFNLHRLIEDLLSLEAGPAHVKGLQVCGVVDHTIPTQLLGDGDRLRQVLLNLVNNAIKHTETGEVLLRVRRLEVNNYRLAFEVIDTGVGIRKADRSQLFEPFTQADSSTTRAFEGTGLGLAISHRLVDMLGGCLRVESKVGVGSRFFFELPFLEAPDFTARSPRPFLRGRTIGIADRHTALVEQVRTIVEPLGGTVCAADSEEEARRLVARTDLLALLVSVDLEGLLQDPPGGTHILPMADLGAELGEDSELVPLLMKPLRASRLLEVLLHCMTGDLDRATSNSRIAAADSRREAGVWKARVLVVDDNESKLLVARLLLERLGCSVDTVSNGNEVLERTQRETFDLVFMDCSMPEVDGYEATRRLRAQEAPGTHNIVIAMTAYALSGDRQRCLEAGMDDYVSKPVDLASIRGVLSRNLGAATTTLDERPPDRVPDRVLPDRVPDAS
jgi:two-component system sensor histidine kinase/response regulator